MILKFTDGVVIDTGGPLRKIHLEDGWYVTGAGFCIPVGTEQEADETILGMTDQTLPLNRVE
jgi:hypothetical protein